MKIKEKQKAPLFILSSTNGKEFYLKNKNKKIVIFFYPKNDTPGCTLETRDFSKLYKKFKNKKCEIIGISKDSIESHLKFKKKNKITFELLSDDKKKVHKLYGVWGLKTFMGKKFMGTIRTTFLIKRGTVIKIWSNVRVKDHAKEVLDLV
tara:strand:- start:426 stop:875 length:450 start_codon:yes stop_codon:yes gene_type:complete